MISQVNFPDDDYTRPLNIESKSKDSIMRSPEYEAFNNNVEGEYRLLAIKNGQNEKVIVLESATYSIGRHEANSIVLNSKAVSRHHATLIRISDSKSKKYYFRIVDGDLNGKASLNGLFVNGQRYSSYDLQDGDVITFEENIIISYFHASNSSDPKHSLFKRVSELPIPALKPDTLNENEISKNKTEGGVSDVDNNLLPSRQSYSQDSMLYRVYSFAELAPFPILETDLNGVITYINPLASVQFQKISLGSQHSLLDGLFKLLQNKKKLFLTREVECNGYIYEQSIHCILQSQLIRSYFVDITHRKQLEKQLYESEQRFALAAKGADDGLWDWNLLNNTIYFSARWKDMIGYENNEIGDTPDEWLKRIHPLDQDRFNQELSRHLEGHSPHFECEYRLCHKDDSIHWFRTRGLAIWNKDHQPERIAGSQTDITAYYNAREQLTHDALHDSMTGLPNRTLFLDRLGQAIKNLGRNESYLSAVLFLDLDRFKLINDSLGHIAGDRLLIEVAHRLRDGLRSVDTVARLGGDEFVILLDNIKHADDAVECAQKILTTLRHPFIIDGQEIYTSASIGIALAGADYSSAEELLRDADIAMYSAKHLGKNRYELFGSSMRVQAIEQLRLETDLQRAIERQEFQLVYQPIVSLATYQWVGLEALVRWHHPERGIIAPAEFIPLAEETGLIIPIGWWVLHQACFQMCDWHLKHHFLPLLSISVNISSKQLAQYDFVDKIKLMLQDMGAIASTLKIEITERTVMQDPTSVAHKFHQLKEAGIDLMMDDFGTGYSSLNYLRTFPLDTLKIDRSFVNQMDNDSGSEIVKTIINLAHNLRMQVIAEGVEDKNQAKCLQELGCEFAQGFFFSEPLDARKIEELISNQTDQLVKFPFQNN